MFGGEIRDVTDNARGKCFCGERRDVTDSARGRVRWGETCCYRHLKTEIGRWVTLDVRLCKRDRGRSVET